MTDGAAEDAACERIAMKEPLISYKRARQEIALALDISKVLYPVLIALGIVFLVLYLNDEGAILPQPDGTFLVMLLLISGCALVLRELHGVMPRFGATHGLIVSWGGFKDSVLREARPLYFQIRLWDAGDLVTALQETYEKLSPELQAELPLKRLWVLVEEE
ncbi:MAG: restriction endonuclease [Rhodospirillales bacterium]|nr:restriction endonuclease [Rhodospirillales bacterium]